MDRYRMLILVLYFFFFLELSDDSLVLSDQLYPGGGSNLPARRQYRYFPLILSSGPLLQQPPCLQEVLRGGSTVDNWQLVINQYGELNAQGISLSRVKEVFSFYGLSANADQAKQLMTLVDGNDLSKLLERRHFEAALAKHALGTPLAKWQLAARFRAACDFTSIPGERETEGGGGLATEARLEQQKSAGWNLLEDFKKEEDAEEMSGFEALSEEPDGKSADSKEKDSSERGAKDKNNRKTRDGGKDYDQAIIKPQEKEKYPVYLVTADEIGKARRDMSYQELQRLKHRMSMSEWVKLSSAKQRRKVRKWAKRDEKQAVKEKKMLEDAALHEKKVFSELPGSHLVPIEHRFDPNLLGRGLHMLEGGRVVRKRVQMNFPSFAFWGKDMTNGISRWTVRIDKLRSTGYIGVAEFPVDPAECFAKFLLSPAWMLCSTGCVYVTQRAAARNPLVQRIIPEPESGQRLDVHIRGIGDVTLETKRKFRKHRYSFKDGSIVKMELNRDWGTLRFCVDNKEWFRLNQVSKDVKPFINFFASGDGITLISAQDGKITVADAL